MMVDQRISVAAILRANARLASIEGRPTPAGGRRPAGHIAMSAARRVPTPITLSVAQMRINQSISIAALPRWCHRRLPEGRRTLRRVGPDGAPDGAVGLQAGPRRAETMGSEPAPGPSAHRGCT